jgi:hypothetical protein
VYPEALEKLGNIGLLRKIEQTHKSEEGLPFIGHTMSSEIIGAVNEMKDEGYFDTLDDQKRESFQQSLQEIFRKKDSMKWQVHREEKVIEELGELEDFYLMTRWLASCVLSKDEIWNHQKYGFDSLEDFLGSFGAAIWSYSHKDIRGGYEWTHQDPNGRTFANTINGDGNLDSSNWVYTLGAFSEGWGA